MRALTKTYWLDPRKGPWSRFVFLPDAGLVFRLDYDSESEFYKDPKDSWMSGRVFHIDIAPNLVTTSIDESFRDSRYRESAVKWSPFVVPEAFEDFIQDIRDLVDVTQFYR